jgi:hypothetical protein
MPLMTRSAMITVQQSTTLKPKNPEFEYPNTEIPYIPSVQIQIVAIWMLIAAKNPMMRVMTWV